MRRLLLLVPLALLLPGCVYTSAVPLDEPGAAPFDEALLGTWVVASETAGDSAVVLRAGEHEYLIQVSDQDGEPELAGAHVTVLRGVHFLNVYDSSDSTYTFGRYVIRGDTLRYRFLRDGSSRDSAKAPPVLGQYHDSDSLRAAVLALLDDPHLFDEDETVLVLRRRPTETFCVDYDVLTASNWSTGELMILAIGEQGQHLIAELGRGTHVLKVPFSARGYGFTVTNGAQRLPGHDAKARLRRACRQ